MYSPPARCRFRALPPRCSRLELNQELEKLVGEGDLLLTMGAGDVTTVGPEFIEYLTAKKDA